MHWSRWLAVRSGTARAARRLLGLLGTRSAAHGLALAITLYAGLLRLDALTGRYGTLDHPTWARVATHHLAPIASRLRPSSVEWTRVEHPYVGGDPINYLAFGRQMGSFYQPHVREPLFLATTRAALWTVDGQDAAVSLASAAGSTLAVFATYLLGAELVSPLAGLIAAATMATDYQAISWAPEGWRDDTFTALVALAAWALLRLRNRPSFWRALVAGGMCGFVCLTRITAISFVAPAAVLLVADAAATPRLQRFRHAVTAALILVLLVAPYLISCAIATGDPLIAIDAHTGYYRYAGGLPSEEPMTVVEDLRTRFADRPVAMLDTGLMGLTVEPFIAKWAGFRPWTPGLGVVLQWLSLAGLAVLPFFAAGRLALVMLLASLLPYCFTWNLGGGGAWRFTAHVCPFLFVAAASALVWVARHTAAVAREPAVLRRVGLMSVARRALCLLAAALLGVSAYIGLPWFVVRESIAAGEATSIETGRRDAVFFRAGWSPPHLEGVTFRVSRVEQPVVHIPLPAVGDYVLVLRIDPVAPERQEHVRVLLNGILVGSPRLSWDPERVGSYRLPVSRRIVRAGDNHLTIIPETLVAAGSAGPRFAWLDPTDRVGVRLWYVRVMPSP